MFRASLAENLQICDPLLKPFPKPSVAIYFGIQLIRQERKEGHAWSNKFQINRPSVDLFLQGGNNLRRRPRFSLSFATIRVFLEFRVIQSSSIMHPDWFESLKFPRPIFVIPRNPKTDFRLICEKVFRSTYGEILASKHRDVLGELTTNKPWRTNTAQQYVANCSNYAALITLCHQWKLGGLWKLTLQPPMVLIYLTVFAFKCTKWQGR